MVMPPFLAMAVTLYIGIYDGDGDGGANFGTATTNPTGIAGYTSTGDNYIAGEDLDGEGATEQHPHYCNPL